MHILGLRNGEQAMNRSDGSLWLALIVTTLAAPVTSSNVPHDPAVERAMEALNQLQGEGFDGSALVACGEQILLHEHYGIELPANQTPSYWVASITKQFTAAAVLDLITETDLTVQTPLKEIFEQVPEDKADITIHELLSHQSGLPQAYASSGLKGRDAALAAILSLPLARAPGSGFGYSNDGYTLLAIIVEVISGVGYETYLERSVIGPAGLRNAAFWPHQAREGEVVPPLATPFASDAYLENWDFRGATGMRLSVEDLHHWVLALDRLQILDQQQLEQLLGPHVTTSSGLRVGYNWFWEETEDGRTLLWTRGQEQYGANAVLYLFPGTDLIIVAATHAGPAETGSGPRTGWSRLARDQMIHTFDQNTCAGREPLFASISTPASTN
jgi:CubicO group peptidase (beta-lactamase class C family)